MPAPNTIPDTATTDRNRAKLAGSDLDSARRELISAMRWLDVPAHRAAHMHVATAVAAVDDALAALAGES